MRLKRVENNLSQTLAEEAILNKKRVAEILTSSVFDSLPRIIGVGRGGLASRSSRRPWLSRGARATPRSFFREGSAAAFAFCRPGVPLARVLGRLASAEGGARRPRDPWPCRESLSVRIRGAKGVRGLGLLSRRGHPACLPVNL